MSKRDHSVVPVVSMALLEAQASVRAHSALLKEAGFGESAGELGRIADQLQVWTQPDGFLSYLEKPDDPEAS